MELKISESQINIAIKKVSFVSPSFEILGSNKFKISLLKSVEVLIQKVSPNQIVISYDSKWFVNRVVSCFRDRIPLGIIVNKGDQLITINTNELMEDKHALLKSLKLKEIYFKGDQLVIQTYFEK
jgi:hypothetical protein